jgi:RNA polymerase sigma-70 factor, ECF subfamily
MTLTDAELAELYHRYAHVVYRRCLSILGNEEDAHDATQETFAKVLRHGERFREESSPLTWMYRISTNHCLNTLRNRKGRRDKLQVHQQDVAGDGFATPEADGLDDEVVRRLLHEVDEQTRQCIVYTYFDDCTRQEVADLVGISVPTVRKRIQAFLDGARRALGVAGAAAVIALLCLLGNLPWSPP